MLYLEHDFKGLPFYCCTTVWWCILYDFGMQMPLIKEENSTTIYSTLYSEPCMLGRNDTTTWTILSDIIWNIRWSVGSTICKSKPHALPSTDEHVQKPMCVSVRVTSAISLWPNDTVLLIQGQHDQHTTCTTTFHNGQGR